jgi:hypothetical protein
MVDKWTPPPEWVVNRTLQQFPRLSTPAYGFFYQASTSSSSTGSRMTGS